MRIRLVGGNNNGRILDLPSDRLGCRIVLPLYDSDSSVPAARATASAAFESDSYVIEALRVNNTLFHFGRSAELTIEQALHLLLMGADNEQVEP